MINVRIAENLLAGHGYVYNVGARVEAATSPLWVALIAACGVFGAPLELAALTMSMLFGAIAVGCACEGARVAFRGEPRAHWPAGALVFLALPPVWDHATAGLELGLSLLWLSVSFWLLARHASGATPAPLSAWCRDAAVIGLGPLVRPDLALMSACFGGGLLALMSRAERPRPRALLAIAASATCLALGYQLFRMGYFASLVPNTAIAKEASFAQWGQGFRYLRNTYSRYLLWFSLPAVALLAWLGSALGRGILGRERRWLVWSPVVAGVFHTLYVVRVGGGFMHGRLLLPGLFTMLMPAFVLPWTAPSTSSQGPGREGSRRVGRGLWLAVGVALCVWAGYVAVAVRHPRQNEWMIGDERRFYVRTAGHPHPVTREDWRHHRYHKGAQVVRASNRARCPDASKPCRAELIPVGSRPYGKIHPPLAGRRVRQAAVAPTTASISVYGALGVFGSVIGPQGWVVDPHGLGDAVAARQRVNPGRRGRPGHEKNMHNAWVAARFSLPTPSDDPQVRAARAALECGDLAVLIEAITAPLTFKRFMTNILLAPRLTRLRFSPRPLEAAQELCGPKREVRALIQEVPSVESSSSAPASMSG